MATCEKCVALEREVEALRKRLAVYDKYRDLLKDSHLEGIVKKMMNVQGNLLNQKTTKYAGINGLARLSEAQAAVSDRLFAQTLTLFELPAKAEQMQVRTDNIRTRTTNIEVDTQLKQEKVRALQADRELKERQAMLIAAATMVMERYAQTGNMVDADFEVTDQLKQIGVKIPARIAQKTLKQTNGAR